MTRDSSPQAAAEAPKLNYAEATDRDGGSSAAMARNIVVIVIKTVGALFIIGALWEGLDGVLRSLASWFGLIGGGYWVGGGDLIIDLVVHPADAYLIGAFLVLSADWIAPFLLPKRWWR